MYGTYFATLEAVIDALPAALLLVNHKRQVKELFISNRRLRHFCEWDLESLLIRFLPSDSVKIILAQFDQVIVTRNRGNIRRIGFKTIQGFEEYADCRILPLQNEHIAILFLNESESVLLEQEFNAMAEQAEAAQRDLCAAISELDFRLMDLDQSHKRLQVLYKVASIVERDVSEQVALEEIIEIVMTEFACVHAAIFLLNDTEETLMLHAHRGYAAVPNMSVNLGITGYATRTRELVFVPDVSQDSRYVPGSPDCVSELAIPLIVSDRVIGVLDLEYSEERSLSPYDLDLLRTIAAQVSVTIAHVQHVAQIKKVAITDELTGLYNFHHFSTLLEQEYRRACRYGHPLSLLMVDIDFFKKINDSFGHLVGNEVLAQVAKLIRLQCREVDWACRYGGEEFAVLLPETTVEEAQEVAERIRSSIANYSFQRIIGQLCPALSVSVGVSGLVADGINKRELIAHADLALFAAKRSSKNCVRVYRCEGGDT